MRFKDIFRQDDSEIERKKPLPWIVDPTLSEKDALLPDPPASGFENDRKLAVSVVEKSRSRKGSSAFPGFKRLVSPHPIELFYELFIVANLSSFMGAQSISNAATLKSYIGYISLLWFTWLQTTLFDVRFNTESIVSRIFRTLQIGFMLAFSILGPNFNTYETEEHPTLLRDVSFVLMATRLVLVLQYGTVAWYVRKYNRTFVAMLVPIVVLFCAAMAYLGIAFAFSNIDDSRAYIGWYTVAGVEALIMLVGPVFPTLKDLTFKKTVIVERFNGLTLIVLGEAVVGMTKAAASVAQGSANITKSSIGLMISYIMTVYFMYMIYFDQLDNTRLRTAGRQIWAILHFPLHIAMLLTIDASRAFIVWDTGRALIEKAGNDPAFVESSYEDTSSVVDGLKVLVELYTKRLATDEKKPDFQPLYDRILKLSTSDEDLYKLAEITDEFYNKMVIWVFDSLDVFSSISGTDRDLKEIILDFDTQSIYLFTCLFVAAGATLVALAMLHWFGKSNKTRGEILSIAITTIIGGALALVSLVMATKRLEVGIEFLMTPWGQPAILLTFALVIAIDSFIIWVSYRRHYKLIV